MSIYKVANELICECDGCGQEHCGGTLEWSEFIQDLKDSGWKIRKEEDEWQHYCDDCQ